MYRFCGQCVRFHELDAFDGTARVCRRSRLRRLERQRGRPRRKPGTIGARAAILAQHGVAVELPAPPVTDRQAVGALNATSSPAGGARLPEQLSATAANNLARALADRLPVSAALASAGPFPMSAAPGAGTELDALVSLRHGGTVHQDRVWAWDGRAASSPRALQPPLPQRPDAIAQAIADRLPDLQRNEVSAALAGASQSSWPTFTASAAQGAMNKLDTSIGLRHGGNAPHDRAWAWDGRTASSSQPPRALQPSGDQSHLYFQRSDERGAAETYAKAQFGAPPDMQHDPNTSFCMMEALVCAWLLVHGSAPVHKVPS